MPAIGTAPSTLRLRMVNLGSTGVVAGVHALCLLAPFAFSWRVVTLCIVSYLLQTLGVTAGYHRYFSHHAFKTGQGFQFVLGWLGCAAMQNGPIWWASGHRRHHRFSDRPGDPHSPMLGGFWHGHLGWVLSGENDHPDLANVRELVAFPELRFLDRFKWLPTIATGVVCGLACGWSGVVWGLGVATTLAFHAPLLVNSAGHTLGTRRFETGDLVAKQRLSRGMGSRRGMAQQPPSRSPLGPPRVHLVGDRRHLLRDLVAFQGRSRLGGAKTAALEGSGPLRREPPRLEPVASLTGRPARPRPYAEVHGDCRERLTCCTMRRHE